MEFSVIQIIFTIILFTLLIIYIYFDYNFTFNNNTNNNDTIEGFEYQQISTLIPPEKMTYNQYIKNEDKPIIKRNTYDLPILKFSLFDSNTYDIDIYRYFRHKVFPCQSISTVSNMETLYQFQQNKCDIAFVSEEQALRYHTSDCRLFNKLWKSTFNSVAVKPNCSAIGVGYYEYVYIISHNNEKKNVLADIITDRIGICGDDYYYFSKLLSMYDYNISSIKLTLLEQTANLIKLFRDNQLDTIFIVSHPKNRDILELSRNQQIKFIKYVDDNLKIKLHQYLATSLVIVEDLNRFYRSGNFFSKSAYECIAIRTILMIRNEIINSSIEYLTRNYIDSLIQLREAIDFKNYSQGINNFNTRDFNFNELVSMHQSIPLHHIANQIYKEEGLIKEENIISCKYIL
jgi:TRAP-type uncharacterized transport system substrate-binding protein